MKMVTQKDSIKNFYDSNISIWIENKRISVRDSYINTLRKHLSQKSVILDIGCGCGWDSEILFNYGYSGVGIDISENAVKFAKALHKQTSWDFFEMDLFNFDPIKQFDSILCSMVVMHYQDLNNFIAKLKSLLKKNGVIALVINNPNLIVLDYKISYPQSGVSVPYVHNFFLTKEHRELSMFLHSYESFVESAFNNGLKICEFNEMCFYSTETKVFNNTNTSLPNFVTLILKNE